MYTEAIPHSAKHQRYHPNAVVDGLPLFWLLAYMFVTQMQISNITWENVRGTSRYDLASSIHCVPQHPCPNMKFINVDITSVNASKGLPSLPIIYQCANIVDQNATGEAATGIPCNAWAPADTPQDLKGNFGKAPAVWAAEREREL